MCVLSGRDGDISTKCRDIRPLPGEAVTVLCGLGLLRSDGKAETAARREDAGLLDRFEMLRMDIELYDIQDSMNNFLVFVSSFC